MITFSLNKNHLSGWLITVIISDKSDDLSDILKNLDVKYIKNMLIIVVKELQQ